MADDNRFACLFGLIKAELRYLKVSHIMRDILKSKCARKPLTRQIASASVAPLDTNVLGLETMTSDRLLPHEGYLQQSASFIEDKHLYDAFISPSMAVYLKTKLPDISDEVRYARVCECLKGLALMTYSPGNIMFNHLIDDVWHYLILQTAQYADICAALPNSQFVHHSSNEYPESTDLRTGGKSSELPLEEGNQFKQLPRVDGSRARDGHTRFAKNSKRIISFFASYRKNFGPFAADRIEYWPPLASIQKYTAWPLDELNAFFMSAAGKQQRSLS